MSDDIFDIVNERDEVIGRAHRNEVHAKALMHRAVHVLVFNSKGEVFLQKRSHKKDRQPCKWDSSTSGHVDAGETYDHCAIRELHEEIGFTPKEPLEPLFKLPAGKETDMEHVWVYRATGEGPFTLAVEEIDEGKWATWEEVARWVGERPQDFAPAFLAIWNRLDSRVP